MVVTVCILAGAAALFVQGKIRSDLVAVSAMILLVLCGVLTPEEGLSGFASPITIMMVGVFIVGGAVFRTGLARMVSHKLLLLAGTNENKLFLLIMLVTSGIGAFVSNTGTVALMLPIVVSLATSARVNPGRFLMPLAFASSMGGMFTLIGTAPNMIIDGVLVEAGFPALGLFSFFPVGVVCVTLGIVALAPMSKMFLAKKAGKDAGGEEKQSLRALADKYRLTQNVVMARVKAGIPLTEAPLKDLDIPGRYGVMLAEIRRPGLGRKPFARGNRQLIPGPDSRLKPGDTVCLVGPFEKVHNLAEAEGLELVDVNDTTTSFSGDDGRIGSIGIAEVVLLSTSKLVNRLVRDSRFRDRYSVSILGIQRNNETILANVKDVKMQAGDALLVQGEWGNIAHLGEESTEWVVVGQPLTAATRRTLDHKAPWAGAILLLMIVAMTTAVVPVVVAVMLAALALIFTGCFRNVEEAYKTINWESVVLIAAMLPMATAIEKTGLDTLASNTLISVVGNDSPYGLLAAIYAATSVMTLFISNTATAVLFSPIAMQAAENLGVSPYPLLFGVTVAASMCFASPFSTPPNALVMSAGRYVFMDYVKVGVPLQILFGLVMVFVLPLIFPF